MELIFPIKVNRRYKMKKFIYIVVSFLIFGINLNIKSVADSKTSVTSFFSEGRIALGLAVEYLNIEAKQKDNFAPFALYYQSERAQTKKKISIAPFIELGTTIINDFYFGIQTSWHYVDAKTKSKAPLKQWFYFNNEFKMKYYIDVLAKPGCKLTPDTMIYGLIGPSIAKWSHTTDEFDVRNDQVSRNRFEVSKTSVGLGLGFGLEHRFKERYLLSVDYVHHFHKSASKHQTMTFVDIIGAAPIPRSGVVSKSVMPSYSTIALRFSTSLRLW